MARTAVPAALRDRLGHQGSLALVDLLQLEKDAWRDEVLSLAEERFERRLSEDCSALRVEFRDGFAALRVEVHDGLAALRVELRQEIAATRVELFKWSFLFWIGQVAATAGLLAFMLRGVSRL